MLACLFVALVVVASIVFSLHHSTSPTPVEVSASASARAEAPTHASASAVAASNAAWVRTSTLAIDAEISQTRLSLQSLSGIPTPAKVAAVLNPYLVSLQNYEAVLSETDVPPAARTAALGAQELVDGYVQFLGTLNGLPSIRLGSYLVNFGHGSTQLQTALRTLERELRPPTT